MAKTVRELVEDQVAAKITAGEELEQAVAAVADKAAELAEAEKSAAAARRSALSAGWTEAELKSLGLASRSRPRRRSAAPAVASHTADDGTSEL